VRSALVVLSLVAAVACRGERAAPSAAPVDAAFDWTRPAAALRLTADDAVARLGGSLEQQARVTWTVDRGEGTTPIAMTERHRVRQLAGGEFEAESTLDPGRGPAGETGRAVIWVGGEAFARSRWSPFRERSTDRGEQARRVRDDSFRLAGDVAELTGPALVLRPAGDLSLLGRPAKRFDVALQDGAGRPAPTLPAGRSADPDTAARLELLEGARPLALDGEVVLDAATAVPLRVNLRGTFGVASDPALRVQVDLDSRVTALGAAVLPVRPPPNAKPDERKPDGPARALEAAGLRDRTKLPAGQPAPTSEDEPPE
jgi:hypothetical protein